jgi:hypothetical protein
MLLQAIKAGKAVESSELNLSVSREEDHHDHALQAVHAVHRYVERFKAFRRCYDFNRGARREDIGAVMEAGKIANEGIPAIAQQHTEILRQGMEEKVAAARVSSYRVRLRQYVVDER